jgi:PAS domain S-box-containing protein
MFADEQQARREAEEALARAQKSERRFHVLMNSGLIGIAMGGGGRILEANDEFLHLTGFSRKDLHLGKVTRESLLAGQAVLARGTHRVLGALATGRTRSFEHEFTRKDGTRVPVLMGVALLERDPRVFVMYAVDLTERKRAEEALRVSEERYRDLVESQTEMVCRYRPDGTLTYVNVAFCRRYGRPREELIGSCLFDLVDVERRDHHIEYLASLQAHPRTSIDEHEVTYEDGTVGWLQWVDHVITDGDGHVVEIQSLGRDITERKRAEEALRFSEARYRDLVESQTEMVCRYRPDGTLTFVNEAYCRHWGRPRQELIGSRFLDLLPPELAKRARGGLDQMLRRPDVTVDEHEAALSDGSSGWQQWTEHAILDTQGQVIELQAIGRDVTERKRVEEALRASEARFRTAFESAAIGMVLVDLSGRTLQANEYVTAMLGYSEDELRARTFMQFTHPDDVDANVALLRAVLRGELDGYQLEKRFIHKDGHVVWGSLSAAVVRNVAEQPLYLVGHVEDITGRKQLEQERDEQAAELDHLFESITDGLIVFDAQGHVRRMNPAAKRMFGIEQLPAGYSVLTPPAPPLGHYTVHDSQGRPLDDRRWWLRRLLGDTALTEPSMEDVRVETVDGRTVDLTATVAPLRDPTGRLTGAVSVLHDRTERNRLLREREEAQVRALTAHEVAQQLDEFLAVASHDIRTPVTALSGNVEMARMRARRLAAALRERGPQDADLLAPLLSSLDNADESRERLVRLVKVLFDVAGARMGTLELTRVPCDLAALVRDHLVAEQMAVPSRPVATDLPEQPVWVEADADRIGQVITNYLENALKYSPEDRPIVVRLEPREGHAVLAVRDYGPGLPREEHDRVWELYHRAPGVEVQSHAGASSGSLGVGLYVCKRLVERHPGGRVGVVSAVGEGSTFWFSLPLHPHS